MTNATMAVAIQGTLKKFILPYAVLGEDNDIYQTGIKAESLPILWGNATIIDFDDCVDPLNNPSIIYL